MYISFELEEAALLRELLERSLKELRVETAHTDSRDYRDMLRQREAIIETLIAKLADSSHSYAV